MTYVEQSGFLGTFTLVAAIKNAMVAAGWSLVYDGTGSNISGNRVVAVKIKSQVNSGGTTDPEYFYAIFEDEGGTAVSMRTAQGMSLAGVAVNFTPNADRVLITPPLTPFTMILIFTGEAVALVTADTAFNYEGGFLCSLITALPSGHPDRNNAFALGAINNISQVWALSSGTVYPAGDYDLVVPLISNALSPVTSKYHLMPIGVKQGVDRFIGFLMGIYKVADLSLNVADILQTATNDYRVIKQTSATEFIVVLES